MAETGQATGCDASHEIGRGIIHRMVREMGHGVKRGVERVPGKGPETEPEMVPETPLETVPENASVWCSMFANHWAARPTPKAYEKTIHSSQ